MNQPTYLFGCLGLFAVIACSSGSSGTGTRAATAMPLTPRAQGARVHTKGTASAHEAAPRALEYHLESESERLFIENAERAIGQYSEFLARAGDREEYAQAVKRSREQIEDLQAAIVFVRAGAAERALR